MIAQDALLPGAGPVSLLPLRIYTGLLGQIGDIIAFGPTVRRIKELFPNSAITFAVSAPYREVGRLLTGLPYIDRVFVTQQYYDRLTEEKKTPFWLGWPLDLRGDDEVAEQRRHDLIFETRPVHRRHPWWEYGHMTAELAHMVGVPGPIDPRTEVCLPPGIEPPPAAAGKLVLHNDPAVDQRKAWSWDALIEFTRRYGARNIVLLGNPGPPVPGVIDLRGQTTLLEAAAIIRSARCYLGVDSGLLWIAGSFPVPCVGLYGTEYVPVPEAQQPVNPRAVYLKAKGSPGDIPLDDIVAALEGAERKAW